MRRQAQPDVIPSKKEHRVVMRRPAKASSEFPTARCRGATGHIEDQNLKSPGSRQTCTIDAEKLGPLAVAYITKMLNCSLETATIPSIWQKSRVIPLFQAGKSPKEAKSYRSVSLLSPMIKLMETSLLPTVMNGVVNAEHQHGFRKGRSTTTSLCEVDQHIRSGLNKKPPINRNIMVALDLPPAFDTVSIGTLLINVSVLEIDPAVKR